jgi:hypothetical protein
MCHSEPYITAQLLQDIHGYCSGDGTLFNHSELSRWALIRNAKQTGLFQETIPKIMTTDSESVKDQWMAWISAERRKRLGLAIYVSFAHFFRLDM